MQVVDVQMEQPTPNLLHDLPVSSFTVGFGLGLAVGFTASLAAVAFFVGLGFAVGFFAVGFFFVGFAASLAAATVAFLVGFFVGFFFGVGFAFGLAVGLAASSDRPASSTCAEAVAASSVKASRARKATHRAIAASCGSGEVKSCTAQLKLWSVEGQVGL